MASLNHIHKYRRVNISKTEGKDVWVMKCFRDNCTHYTQMHSKVSCPLLRDVKAICNKCGNSFVLDRRALQMAKPTCFACVNHKSVAPNEIEKAAKFFEELERSLTGDSEGTEASETDNCLLSS